MNALWLVDLGYVVQQGGPFKLDYIKVRGIIARRTAQIVDTILFNGYDPDFGVDQGQQQFYHQMAKNGMAIRVHPMIGGKQRYVDVDIASHMIEGAMQKRICILTSGDRDFVPAVDLAERYTSVVLYTFGDSVNDRLIEVASHHWFFESDREEIERAW